MRWLLMKKSFSSRVCGVQASMTEKGCCHASCLYEEKMCHTAVTCSGRLERYQQSLFLWNVASVRNSSLMLLACSWGYDETSQTGVILSWHYTHTLQRRLTICSCLDVHQQSSPCDSVPQHFQNSHSPFLKFFCDHIWLVFFGRPNFLLNITNMSNIIWHPTII